MKAEELINFFKENGISIFSGVPCSVFKEVIDYLEKNERYYIATSEGEALGMAAGFSLAGKLPAVFMQNDGLANALNPISSLQKIYQLSTLLVISWRGEPGIKDAPQHIWSGKTLPDLLKLFEIDYVIVDHDLENSRQDLTALISTIRREQKIGAVICRKGLFEKKNIEKQQPQHLLTREQAISVIMGKIDDSVPVFSTTGKPSRELYQCCDRPNNFYVVGSMGLTSAIAFGYCQANPQKVVVLDGDGAVLMHLGNCATLGYYQPRRLLHICLDNECYESTGGQSAVSNKIDLWKVAAACNYSRSVKVTTEEELNYALQSWNLNPQLTFLHIKVRNSTNPSLGRPTETPPELKNRFMAAT